ncbi:hypothetical protein DXG01_000466 [Tephrocybe rancida]|nr:hypothetical protein DXG01_000466 [Tephrocybe rancida]
MRVDCVPSGNNGERGLQDNSSQAGPQIMLSNLYARPRPGVDVDPRFSWTLSSKNHCLAQVSYQVFLSKYRTGSDDVWNSGVVQSSKARSARYAGPLLASHTRYFWSIRVETTEGPVTESSHFKTGRIVPPAFSIQRRDSHDPLASTFRLASWIWTLEANKLNAPAGDRAFRRTYTPPGNLSSVSADVIMTVDDCFSLYVDGTFIGEKIGWETAQRFNVTLKPGPTVFAVRGTNLSLGPAGLLTAIEITHSDGTAAVLTSDDSWRATQGIPSSFEQPQTDDSIWPAASAIEKFGVSPWFSIVAVPVPVTTPTVPSAPTTTTTISGAGSTATSAIGTSSPPPTATNPAGAIVGAVLGCVILLSLLVVVIWFRKRIFKSRHTASELHGVESSIGSPPPIQQLEPFTLEAPISFSRGKGNPLPEDPSQSQSSNTVGLRSPSGGGTGVRRETDEAAGAGSSNATLNRLQRLQDLVSELNREVAERGEGGPYVSELRGRIAELVREDSENGHVGFVALPPAYRSPSTNV